MSGDPEQEYFSDGIADEIITELSRSRSLFVIARNSSFTYKGRAVDIKQVARELGVRYVLEGSVRRSGGRVRVIAQLIEGETSNHIWADRYDGELSDIFSVQDKITAAVATAVLPAISDAELRRILRKPPGNLGSWEAYQRGLWHMGRSNPRHNLLAQQFFDQAIDADGSFAPAYSAWAMAVILDWAYGTRQTEEVQRTTTDRAQHAVDIDPNDVEAQAVLALSQFNIHGDDRALANVSEMLRQNPNAAWAHGIVAMLLIQLDRYPDGRAALLAAERLNPRDPSGALFPSHFAISYYYERDYVRAITAAKNVIARYPDHPIAYRFLAASLGQLGQTEEAHEALQTAMQGSFARFVRNRPPWVRPANYEHVIEGLRKAGWHG
jgi:adenylate cyclase